MINNVLLVVEELLVIHNLFTEIINIDVKLSYSEKRDTLELIIESGGEEGNMLEKTQDDEIGLTIIKRLTENIEYHRVNGRNRLSMFMKQ